MKFTVIIESRGRTISREIEFKNRYLLNPEEELDIREILLSKTKDAISEAKQYEINLKQEY